MRRKKVKTGLILAFSCLAVSFLHPQDLSLSEVQGRNSFGWIELHNPSERAENIAQYELFIATARGEGESIQLSEDDIWVAPGEYFVICLPLRLGDENCGLRLPVDTVLDRNGGFLTLLHQSNCRDNLRIVDSLQFPPLITDRSFGRSGERLCLLAPPSPGAVNSACHENSMRARINEIVTSESGFLEEGDPASCSFVSCPDWIEIRHAGGAPLNLGGYQLINDTSTFTFPDGIWMGPGPDYDEYLIVILSQLQRDIEWPADALQARFALKRRGDGIVLQSPENESSQHVLIPELALDESYALDKDARWRITTSRTPRAINAFEATGNPPSLQVFDRFPLRVHIGDEITVFAEIADVDGDLKSEAIVLEVENEAGLHTEYLMALGKRRAAERLPEDDVFVATFSAGSDLGILEYRIRAEDRAGNLVVSEPFELLVQSESWVDTNLGNPTHFLRINEVASNQPGKIGDWVEILNTSDNPEDFISLDGMLLTDDILERFNRHLPPGILLGGGERLVIFCDGNFIPDPLEPHMPFRLSNSRDELILFHSSGAPGDELIVVDMIEWHEEKPGKTLGRFPDGTDFLSIMPPTPGASNVLSTCIRMNEPGPRNLIVINEIMADNWTSASDEGDEFGDYLELYNRSEVETISFDGWLLSDLGGANNPDPSPRNWFFPTGMELGPGEHRLIWCDNDVCENPTCPPENECLSEAEIHTNFEINRLREYIALYDETGRLVDCASVAFLGRDVAAGRLNDGSSDVGLVHPSPGFENLPFDEEASFHLQICAEVDRINGFTRDHCERVDYPVFRRGDFDADCNANLTDAINILTFLFLGGTAPACPDSADVNDSGGIDLADSIGLLNWNFLGGQAPSPPGPFVAGVDPTEDLLGTCASQDARCE